MNTIFKTTESPLIQLEYNGNTYKIWKDGKCERTSFIIKTTENKKSIPALCTIFSIGTINNDNKDIILKKLIEQELVMYGSCFVESEEYLAQILYDMKHKK